jgi:hypothetical protein
MSTRHTGLGSVTTTLCSSGPQWALEAQVDPDMGRSPLIRRLAFEQQSTHALLQLGSARLRGWRAIFSPHHILPPRLFFSTHTPIASLPSSPLLSSPLLSLSLSLIDGLPARNRGGTRRAIQVCLRRHRIPSVSRSGCPP